MRGAALAARPEGVAQRQPRSVITGKSPRSLLRYHIRDLPGPPRITKTPVTFCFTKELDKDPAGSILTAGNAIAFPMTYPGVTFADVIAETVINVYNRTLRSDIGFSEEDVPILQSTRVVSRKGIEYKGFDMVTIHGFLTGAAVKQVEEVYTNQEHRRAIVENNFEPGGKYFSYSSLNRGSKRASDQLLRHDPFGKLLGQLKRPVVTL
jgi:hypothetical protein